MRGATSLSRCYRSDVTSRSTDRWLARTWLCAAVPAMLLVGCILPEPSEYRRNTTPPYLWSPEPSTMEVLRVVSHEARAINVLVKSEDADGDDLWAFLYLNYLVEGQDQQEVVVLPAATLTETREIDILWTVPARPTPGPCEQLSLIVSHRSNFVGNMPERDDDVATLTWWVDINGSEETLRQCPRQSGGNP